MTAPTVTTSPLDAIRAALEDLRRPPRATVDVLDDLRVLAKALEADRKPRPGEPRDPVVRHLGAAVIHLTRAGQPGGISLELGTRAAVGELEQVVYFLGGMS